MENRKGLVAAAKVVPATGTAEPETAIEMLAELQSRGQVTVGADKAYDTHEFVERLRDLNVTPHVAQNHKRRGGSAIDARTTRHAGYEVSQRIRFRWGKTVGGLRQTKYRSTRKVDFQFVLTMTAYNLVRLRNLPHPAPA